MKTAIPIAIAEQILGGMQVIATTNKFFTELRYLDRYSYSFRSGQNMGAGGEFDAVLGYTAARKTNTAANRARDIMVLKKTKRKRNALGI